MPLTCAPGKSELKPQEECKYDPPGVIFRASFLSVAAL